MKFINFVIVKCSFFLTLGIVLASLNISFLLVPVYSLILCVIFLWILRVISKKQLIQNVYFGFVVYTSFFLIGFVSYQIKLPDHDKRHYSHYHDSGRYSLMELKITEILKSDSYNEKYLAEVKTIEGHHVSGKTLLYIKKDSLFNSFSIDNLLLISAQVEPVKPALNPNQFDYSKHMRSMGVHHQIWISKKEILLQDKGSPSLRGVAEGIRQDIIQRVGSYTNENDEFSIFQALVLGQRKEISNTMYDQYAKAGAIHILAVSGLHVGIIYLILTTLFQLIKRVPFSKMIIPISIVICLWGYASITGLSPSVVRSVTMFSLYAIAKNFNRTTNTINTLFLSYFFLLLINPLWLFQVGFQLSYLAVFFILWVQPKLYSFYQPRTYLDRSIWAICTVSIAAQIGIIPLSLYYFHQFPGLFLITNLVILPFLSLLLGGGIMIIILAVLNSLPETIANSYWYLIELLNTYIGWVSDKDAFIIDEIPFSIGKTLFSYLVIFALVLLCKKINYQNLIYSLVSIALLIGVFILDKNEHSRSEMVIFHKSRKTYVGFKHSDNFILYKNEANENLENDQLIRSYLTSNNIKFYSEDTIPEVFSINKKLVLIPDSVGNHSKIKRVDLLILTNNPRVNLDRLIKHIDPKLIVVDGNNYRTFVERWKTSSRKRNVSFHYTGEMGAFIIR